MRHVRSIFCVENEIGDQIGGAKGVELFRDVEVLAMETTMNRKVTSDKIVEQYESV